MKIPGSRFSCQSRRRSHARAAKVHVSIVTTSCHPSCKYTPRASPPLPSSVALTLCLFVSLSVSLFASLFLVVGAYASAAGMRSHCICVHHRHIMRARRMSSVYLPSALHRIFRPVLLSLLLGKDGGGVR